MRRFTFVSALVSMLAAASPARADVKIADDVWNGGGRFSGLDYDVSEPFERAWLVLHFRYDGPCRDSDGPCELDEPKRVRVAGLTYDTATRRVLYREGSEPAQVCAQVVHHSFILGWDSLEATGNCAYHTAPVDQLVDDGFGGHRDRRQEVLFGPSAAKR
jgi:hypothetical protein